MTCSLQRTTRPRIAVAILASSLLLAIIQSCESEREREREHGPPPAKRVSTEREAAVVELDQATQMRSGIAVATLEGTSRRQETKAYGTTLNPQEIAESRNAYVAAVAQAEKARAIVEASHKEYERLHALHRNDRNVSDKLLQSAEATWRSDEANAAAAQMSLRTTTSSLRQQWGEALAQWLMNSAPQLDRLVTARDVLLQITLPVGTRTDAPAPRARVQSPAGAFASATFICEAPHTDPRLQGRSFFYQADAHDSGLRPGMSVTAYLSAPSELAGVLVPQSAIVWWQGKAWLYLQRDAEHFERREIVLDTPVDGDWFVTERIQPGQRVVVAGAQLLLSEELRAQMGSAEEEQE